MIVKIHICLNGRAVFDEELSAIFTQAGEHACLRGQVDDRRLCAGQRNHHVALKLADDRIRQAQLCDRLAIGDQIESAGVQNAVCIELGQMAFYRDGGRRGSSRISTGGDIYRGSLVPVAADDETRCHGVVIAPDVGCDIYRPGTRHISIDDEGRVLSKQQNIGRVIGRENTDISLIEKISSHAG